MILIDTSAWVEFLRDTKSPVCVRVDKLLNGDIAICEPVRMEVLAGARTDAREADLNRLLRRFALLAFDPVADFDAAARIYRRCRTVGITPRGLVDCMIASVAWRLDASLLTCDADLVRVATVIGIAMDDASLHQ